MLDFADAASEWGSTVLLPAAERERMDLLSGDRRVWDEEVEEAREREEYGVLRRGVDDRVVDGEGYQVCFFV